MKKKNHIDAFGAISLITFSVLLGLNQVMIKLVNEGIQPLAQAGFRSLAALPLVFLLALFMRRKISISDGSLVPGILTGVLFAAEFILLFLALDLTTVSRASIFFYTMPFWLAVCAHFLIPGEQLTPLRIAGLILAIVGVAIAMSRNETPATEYALAGDLICLLAAMCWAGIALTARLSNLSKSAPEMQLLYQLAVSAPLILFAALWYGPFIRELQPFHWGIFAFQVVVIVTLGFSFWFWILSKYPASDMASFSFLAPVFGVIFGWLILGEEIGAQLIAALIMVGIGIVLVNRKKTPKLP